VDVGTEKPSSKDWYQAFGYWIGVISALGLGAIFLVELTGFEFGEVCDPLFEPASAILWAAAAVATVGPALYAIWTKKRPVIAVALIAAALEGLFWWWIFSPTPC